MNARSWAIIAALCVALFYAGNFSIAKSVTPTHIGPFGLTWFRVLATGALFWIIHVLFGVKEKVPFSDMPRIALAAFCGVGFNMITFMWGLSLTSPISASVLMVTTPMIVLVLSAIFLKEPLRKIRLLGILIGFIGAVFLILKGNQATDTATNPLLGNFLIFINAVSYSFYIIFAKKLTAKYHPFTLLPWLYTFGIIIITPFGISEGLDFDWNSSAEVFLGIGYVILFATVGTYMLNIFAIKTLKPSVVAVFVYLQPLLAGMIAMGLGNDSLNWEKIVAGLLIFIGVYLTTMKVKEKA